MKDKIKEALKQGRENLGLGDEVFERVAASVETFVTSEEDIDKYVSSELVNNLLKFEQADADRKRTKKIKSEGEKQKATTIVEDDKPGNDEKSAQESQQDISAIIAQAVAAAINPLQEKLTAFEKSQSQKSALAALDELKNTWDYAKGYPDECADAYDSTIELYEAYGKNWSADELTAKFKEKFNKAVKRKGVLDTSKPLNSDGDNGDDANARANKFVQTLIKAGKIETNKK